MSLSMTANNLHFYQPSPSVDFMESSPTETWTQIINLGDRIYDCLSTVTVEKEDELILFNDLIEFLTRIFSMDLTQLSSTELTLMRQKLTELNPHHPIQDLGFLMMDLIMSQTQ